MTFILPFDIGYPNKEDFVLSKKYAEKAECYLLTIPAEKHLSEPLFIKFKPTASDLSFSLYIELEEESSATIIEEWSAEFESPSAHYLSHIHCKAGSNLKYVVLQLSSQKAMLNENRISEVEAQAACQLYHYNFGTQKLDSSIQQKTIGEGAQITTDVVCKAQDTQELLFRCEHLYTGKNGTGDISMKGIAQNRGILTFDGIINIAQTGLASSGFLDQEVLNLSPETVVKAVPGLKIDTNDVKAGHRAAIRNLNEEDFYYFAARGIDEETAKKLLITGFLGKELRKIEELESVYETIKKLI